MARALVLLILLSCNSAARAGDWETKDTAMLGGAVGLLAIDWAQTRKVTTETTGRRFTNRSLNPFETEEVQSREHHETNPLIGGEPSNAEINRHFIVSIAGTVGLAYVLPPFWRRAFLGSVIVVETAVVIHNDQVGLRLTF